MKTCCQFSHSAFCSYNVIQTKKFFWSSEIFPFFRLFDMEVKCCVCNTNLFGLKLIMELTLDHLCSKWMPFRGSTWQCILRSCTKYLQNNLPFDNQAIKYARFFQPSLQQSIATPNAISRLTISIAQVLGTDKMGRYLKLGSTATKFDFCVVVKKEFREYQT